MVPGSVGTEWTVTQMTAGRSRDESYWRGLTFAPVRLESGCRTRGGISGDDVLVRHHAQFDSRPRLIEGHTVFRDRQSSTTERCVVAVEMVDGCENEVGLADVLDVVQEEFAWPEMEVACVARAYETIRHVG